MTLAAERAVFGLDHAQVGGALSGNGIAQKHHGRITVDTEPGRGTAFRVHPPVHHIKETP
ncbi:hypothetical protein [Rugamonas sp.]|uniref:hypothetical protein n=1 Tax=Rugamonas sp. TaxID=1926287 RepID=UPI0025CFAEE2|nr:hypothetical protein [Rugamonas sp.]